MRRACISDGELGCCDGKAPRFGDERKDVQGGPGPSGALCLGFLLIGRALLFSGWGENPEHA